MKRRKKSEKIIAHLKDAKRYSRLAYRSLVCFKLGEDKIEYSKEQKEKMYQASRLFYEAESIVEGVYAEMIGKEIVREL
jgi:hypothetical protein